MPLLDAQMTSHSNTAIQYTATHAVPDQRCPPCRSIGPTELSNHAAHLGHDYYVNVALNDPPPIEGHFGVDTLPGGLVLRRAWVRNLHNLQCRLQLSRCIKLVLILAGEVHISFGGRTLPTKDKGCHAYAIHLYEPAKFERRAQCNSWERSLTLTIPHEWLHHRLTVMRADQARQPESITEDVCIQRWRPSAQLRQQAERIFAVSENQSVTARRLHSESLALAMVADALPILQVAQSATEPPYPLDSRRLRRMRDLVETPQKTPLSVEELARQVGMSRSSMQRHFRTCYGMSVQRLLRERRLQAADHALRSEQVSVMKAAEIAGYKNAANFATAFKRMYGLTPSAARHQA